MAKIEHAIVSVSDKTGIVEFSQTLVDMGVKIFSTGGTASALRDAGIDVTDVSEYTGFPEMMDGRVKTLHPKIHGGILARRENPDDMNELKKHAIKRFDMIIVNLYPFEKTIARKDVTFDEAVENIDIGGPSMLRAAAKNFKDVVVIIDSDDYGIIIKEMHENNGEINQKTRLSLAQKVFSTTARYDSAIADYLALWENKEK